MVHVYMKVYLYSTHFGCNVLYFPVKANNIPDTDTETWNSGLIMRCLILRSPFSLDFSSSVAYNDKI